MWLRRDRTPQAETNRRNMVVKDTRTTPREPGGPTLPMSRAALVEKRHNPSSWQNPMPQLIGKREKRGRPNQPWGLSQKKSERRSVREPKRLKRWAPHQDKGRKPLESSCGGHTTEKVVRFSVWAPHKEVGRKPLRNSCGGAQTND